MTYPSMHNGQSRRRRSSGLTLIEVMVVLVLIGILSAVGWSQYRDQLNRGIRGDAITALTRAATQMEQCHSASVPSSYADCSLENMGAGECSDKNLPMGNTVVYSPQCRWIITLTNLGDNSYTLNATRDYKDADNQDQTDVLTLDHLGRKTGPWPK